MNDNWHSLGIETILEALKTNKTGLTNKEAKNRLLKDGKNSLPKGKQNSLLKVFLRQFNNPIIYILFIAIILSLIIGEIIDAFFVIFVILIDVVLGTIQEWQAEKS